MCAMWPRSSASCAAGRKQLGDVDDFQAVLTAFRALDPAAKTDAKAEDDDTAEDEAEDWKADRPPIPSELAAAVAVIDSGR